MSRDEVAAAPAQAEAVKPLEALKTVTQKLKGVTQQIPQQAILHKTGIIADGASSEAQKEAAKHKTARISLSDAMGVAPVKSEPAPMKTIRIKRPVNLPNPAPAPAEASAAPEAEAKPAADAEATVTQRKTLKISRPGTAVRPSGKFALKKPGAAAKPAETAPAAAAGAGDVADIPEIPDMPASPAAAPAPAPVARGEAPAASMMTTTSLLALWAACLVMGALAYCLYELAQAKYF